VLGQTAWTGGFLAALAGLYRHRLISMVHTHGEPRLCNTLYAPARFAYRHCRRTLATNRAFSHEALAWGAPGPVYLSGNIVKEVQPKESKDKLRQRLGYAPEFFHVACVGRLVYEHGLETKGFSYALKALPKLPEVILHIYGDGASRPEFEALARAEGVADRAVFHGAVEREILYHGLAAADALLMTSLSEGLSMTMIEGMMLGLPVVITKTAGAMDYVRHGENGLLIEPGSDEAIAGALSHLKDNPTLAKSLAEAGYATYKENFTAERVARSFLAAVDGTGESVSIMPEGAA
jgi:glycosyltransferase involved in cell wall biosynthesis